MVALKIYLCSIFLSALIKLLSAQSTTLCDTTTTFSGANLVTRINWPQRGNTKTFCTYIVRAPADHYLRASLSFDLAGTPPSCSNNQYVGVSIDNMLNWDGFTKFCGSVPSTNPIIVQSIGNEIKIGVSSSDFSRRVNITVTSVKTTALKCDCSWNPRTRIINGVDAVPNEFISHVGFKAQIGSFVQSFCGGTIITQNHAITAAHCVRNMLRVFGLTNVVMRAGSHNITAPLSSDTVYAAEYKLITALTHPSYNSQTNAHDIGIVKTTTYIRFTRGVGPACLPFRYTGFLLEDRTPLTAVGFGSTEYAMDPAYDTDSWILKKVTLQVNSTVAPGCNSTTQFCVQGALNGYVRGDTCTRDSGGPVYGYMWNRYFSFGVISRGIDCGSINSYSFNMYVVAYFSWIRTQIGASILCDFQNPNRTGLV